MPFKRCSALLTATLSLCLAAYAGEVLPPSPVDTNDYPSLRYPLTGNTLALPRVWKYSNDVEQNGADPALDVSGWKDITVGRRSTTAGWRWYRTAFDLPADWQGSDVLLDLGRVSVYDEVFVNGEKIGSWGTPPPHLLHGSSGIWRKYPISAAHLRPGRNVLAIKIFLGQYGGLYQGPYTLQRLGSNSIVGKLNLKSSGVYALEQLLTEAEFRNQVESGAKTYVGPSLWKIFGGEAKGTLSLQVLDSQGRVLERDDVQQTLQPEQWANSLFSFTAPRNEGTYACEVVFTVDGKQLWKERIQFSVQSRNRIAYTPKVDASLKALERTPFPVNVSDVAMGNLGPRESTPELELRDDLTKTDARSSMAYTVQTSTTLAAPRLFLGNVRPVPEDYEKVGRFHRAAGHEYDGLMSSWIYGSVRPNRPGRLANMTVKSTSWAKRTYRYEYESNQWMEFSLSTISPAWTVQSNAQKVRVFDEIGRHGIGLPQYLAYESNGQVKVVDAKTGIRGSDMSANWVLAWFNGGKNWNEFDTPYLFTVQKRPERVHVYADAALFFDDTDEAGIIQGMPLDGVTLQRLGSTATWSQQLPSNVVERCREWSRILVNAPDQVKRTAQIDYATGQLTVKDEFTHLDIKDAWNTPGLKIAPLSPVLALSAASGNIDIAVSQPTQDLQMATLQGPLVAAKNAQSILFRVNGLLKFVRDVRQVAPQPGSDTAAVKAELNAIVREGLNELRQHPWKSTLASNRFKPGAGRIVYTNLLLTLPYLDEPLRSEVEKEIATETENYYLYDGIPNQELGSKLLPELRKRPTVAIFTNPVSGLKFAMPPLTERGLGIDMPYFSTLNVYMAWLYADTFNRYDWVRPRYELVKNLFNTTRNSHDWTIGVSWDTFSGLRVGNGLQESGGIFAGAVGMARIAHALQDKSSADAASYYAVMQAVGMNAQLSASDYLRQRRPWLASNLKAADIEFVQKIRPAYHAEFNEFAGLSQALIGVKSSASSAGGFIESPLPEVMRLYQEIWPEFTNEFYDPKYDKIIKIDRRVDDRISLDAFVYQMTRYPQSVDEVFAVRKALKIDWWDKLPDYRAYLDSKGKREYRKLW